MAINTSDPKVQKALLVILLAGGLAYAWFTYMFQPRQEELATLEEQVKRVETDLATAQAIVQAADTAALRSELEKRARELELAEALLPREENLPRLLQEVTLEADRQGLKFALFEPKPPVQHELYQERPYQVTLRGGYHQTAAFLSNVAGLRQIVKPSALRIIREDNPEDDSGETVSASMLLTTYLMIPAPPAPKAAPKTEAKK
ncbi:type 4a pilus biogenesis protein PilO [bacterium]|nr:type 4a pilus biogenesis protein PilO [bacterium]